MKGIRIMITQLFAAYGPQGGASGQSSGGGSPMSLIFMIIAIFAVMYFLMIRPQQRQKKQHQDMMSQLSKGDKVVTTGGIHGTVAGVKDSLVILKIADNVKVEINRSSVSQIVSSRASKAQAKGPQKAEEKSGKSENKE
jgi:preprotein translocase subunit YajC